jgi:hypothetical protein
MSIVQLARGVNEQHIHPDLSLSGHNSYFLQNKICCGVAPLLFFEKKKGSPLFTPEPSKKFTFHPKMFVWSKTNSKH